MPKAPVKLGAREKRSRAVELFEIIIARDILAERRIISPSEIEFEPAAREPGIMHGLFFWGINPDRVGNKGK